VFLVLLDLGIWPAGLIESAGFRRDDTYLLWPANEKTRRVLDAAVDKDGGLLPQGDTLQFRLQIHR
jgi:hypothetical protein